MRGVRNVMKRFFGVIIILVGLGLLVSWEVYGRQVILTQEVVVASKDIQVGEKLRASQLSSVAMPKNALVDGFVGSANKSKLVGMTANASIFKNAQISRAMVSSEKDRRRADMSSFVIKKEWIDMRSADLRRGDEVEILSSDGKLDLGRFEVSHVKDINDEEISDSKMTKTSLIDHVEILCKSEDYLKISEFARASQAPTLVLVIRKANI